METGTKLGSQELGESRFQLGTNQSGMRAHNERLVLSLVRQHGSLAKSDIARATKLSAQTVSVIMRELERDGLLLRQAPVRGKVGQPSIPMSLNPEGAFFLGLKIGRRSAELVLIDFVGTVREMEQCSYLYPAPDETVAFVRSGIRSLRAGLSPDAGSRASPGSVSPCRSNCGTGPTRSARRARSWTNGAGWTFARRSSAKSDFPVYLQNDATSACGAELVFGTHRQSARFRLFLHRRLCWRRRRAQRQALWRTERQCRCTRLHACAGTRGQPVQLIDVASVDILEESAQGART